MTTFNPIAAFRSLLSEPGYASSRQRENASYRASLLAGRAIVSDTIYPHEAGRVHFHGSWWPAACEQPITIVPGVVVQVIGRRNITLVVEPV